MREWERRGEERINQRDEEASQWSLALPWTPPRPGVPVEERQKRVGDWACHLAGLPVCDVGCRGAHPALGGRLASDVDEEVKLAMVQLMRKLAEEATSISTWCRSPEPASRGTREVLFQAAL